MLKMTRSICADNADKRTTTITRSTDKQLNIQLYHMKIKFKYIHSLQLNFLPLSVIATVAHVRE